MVDKAIVGRFQNVIAKARKARASIESGDRGDSADPLLWSEWISQSRTLLSSLFSAEHPYVIEFAEAAKPSWSDTYSIDRGTGVLIAAQEDFVNGYLWNVKKLVHSDLFDNYLQMAEYLVKDGGFKDAAAVIAGSTLEAYLRELCGKNNMAIQIPGKDSPKKASALNDELRLGGVYSQAECRQVQAWLDLRNDAAHGNYGEYTRQQVELMISGIVGFIARHPA